MKLNILCFFLMSLYAFETSNVNLVGTCIAKLNKGLTFIDNFYEDINFDGLFGVILAEAKLLQNLDWQLDVIIKNDILDLIQKCRSIQNKIIPLLPDQPVYMKTFRKNLLDSRKWSNVTNNPFVYGKLLNLGIYTNWTTQFVLKNKEAVFKGVKSDECLREILESDENKSCIISKFCDTMMLDRTRVDTGYLLTHRLLYLHILNLQHCSIDNPLWNIMDYMKFVCSYIYKEAKTSEMLGYPYHDIFIEQVLLCGMTGFEEFLKEKWLLQILSWQNSHGCYKSVSSTIQTKFKRTSNVIDYGCSDHTSGLGVATISLYVNYLLYGIYGF